MRQAGIIAASGITALEKMIDRLTEDHKNARRLAEGIVQIKGLSIDLARVQTNIIYFDLISRNLTPEQFITRFEKKGIKFLCTGQSRFRMVTHYGILPEDIDTTLTALNDVMADS